MGHDIVPSITGNSDPGLKEMHNRRPPVILEPDSADTWFLGDLDAAFEILESKG